MATHYEILGVGKNFTEKELKAARNNLVKKYSTDGNENGSDEMMAQINTAYRVLRDPKRRKEYDASLSVGSPSPRHARKKTASTDYDSQTSEEMLRELFGKNNVQNVQNRTARSTSKDGRLNKSREMEIENILSRGL
ncbi:MAG: DnaJ domain-containing protein [Defluviitaleaceae bacterium]|nr:DnaJ domain-containing protein [Defluviitaleaceae bacterium]